MIVCRSLFFRVDQVLKLKSLKPDGHFQGFGTYHALKCKVKMAGRNDKKNKGSWDKKLKSICPAWRPISAQASSYEECSSNVKAESEAEFSPDVKYGVSTSVLDDQVATEVTESVTKITTPVTSASVSDGIEEGSGLEGLSAVSAEKHSILVKVGASLIRFIVGKGGATQKKIEEDLGVTIVIPSSRKEDFIEGASVQSVHKASAAIQAIINQAVNSRSLDYSHFISLPLALHPELVNKLFLFQNSILGCSDPRDGENVDSNSDEENAERGDEEQKLDQEPKVSVKVIDDDDKERVKGNKARIPLVSYASKSSMPSTPSGSSFNSRLINILHLTNMGIEKSIFIKPKTFHLTVLMLKLWNTERVDAAAEVLKNISSQVMDALDNRPISIRLRGLDCMKGTLAKARVVYVPVEENGGEGRLLRACQVIIDAFVKSGLVLEKDANNSLKLHATVMNARHRKRVKGSRPKDFFDARSIFKKYGSEDWGEYVIREAHLSQRYAYDENGYYHCCGSIPFP